MSLLDRLKGSLGRDSPSALTNEMSKTTVALGLAVLLVLLSGCAASPTPQQLAMMSDDDLCAAAQRDPLRYSVAAAVEDRGLTCHPIEQACTALGYGPDRPEAERRECAIAIAQEMQQDRQQRADQEAARQATMDRLQRQNQEYVEAIRRQQDKSTTFCQAFGEQVWCETQ